MDAAAGLHSKSGIIRKLTTMMLKLPRSVDRLRGSEERPPVLANSFPKSGTHLLEQIVAQLPGLTNYGSFLASMTSSFFFVERTREKTLKRIQGFVPGELIRAHLFFSDEYQQRLNEKRVVHFFIYRDPRDVVVSEAHYLRNMNRWHRLSPDFRATEDPIMLAIRGLGTESYPSIERRYQRYLGWLSVPNTLAIRYEDLTGEHQTTELARIVEFYARHHPDTDVEGTVAACQKGIRPSESHTYRKGGGAGKWREKFSDDHRKEFKEIAGQLLVDLGYEANLGW